MNTPLKKASEPMLSSSNLSRWKRITSSSAMIGAAAASSASARTVQITLQNEQATASTTSASNTFTGDFTGDGVNDVPSWGGSAFSGPAVPVTGFKAYLRTVATFTGPQTGRVGFASVSGVSAGQQQNAGNPVSNSALIPFVFTDARINGGAATNAWLEVNASNTATSATVRAVRSVFDDASTARPTDAVAGGSNREFVSTVSPRKTSLAAKIKKLRKKAKRASRAGQLGKAKKLRKKIRSLVKRLNALS